MKQPLILLAAVFATLQGLAQTGYDISIELKPYQQTYVYLGYYYGKTRALADSAWVDEHSAGRFKGAEALPGGIYFIVSPSKQILFEVLVDKDQHFSIQADTTLLPDGVRFKDSPENIAFKDYSSYANRTGREINRLTEEYKKVGNGRDSATILARVKELTGGIQHYRDSIIHQSPESFLATLFNSMHEPRIPPASEHPGGKYDSNFVYEYYKEHYWDGISFNDDRLVRTPFFEARLEKYFRDLVAPHPDSLIKEIDYMLLFARSAKEMYKFLMVHFVQAYINPKYMGHDAVFVHLFEKFINTGQAPFFTEQYREFTERRAYSLMANLIGKQAAELDMVDTLDRPLPLFSLNSNFTVICFWDPSCSHCKEVVPKVDSIFNAKWKNQGVEVYGVKVSGTREDWVKFISDNHLTGWKHVYQPASRQEQEISEKRPGYRQLYDVYQTPILYLLDKDKRIIAKKLTYQQIDEVIDAKIRSKTN